MVSTLTVLLFRWWWVMGKGNNENSSISGLEIIGALILLMLLLWIIYFRVTRALEKDAPKIKVIKPTVPLSPSEKAILSEKFSYYHQLNDANKELFEKRVKYYLGSKMFTSEEGYAITEEMKVLASASATQISFGLPATSNSNFTHVLFTPHAGFTPRSATKNAIVIPWREFVDGYSANDDGKNEGLKAFATALIKDNESQDNAYKIFAPKKYKHWNNIFVKEAGNFMGGIFKDADKDNNVRNEYFAQSMVYFFELPNAFRQKYPTLYEALADLIGQDPIKKTLRK